MTAKKPGFRDYLQALKQMGSSRTVAASGIFIIYGKAPWLVQEAVRTLRTTARRDDLATAAVEGKDVTEGLLSQICSQSSLFEPATLYIVNKAEQAKILLSALANDPGGELANKIALVFSGDKVPAAVSALLTAKSTVDVPCFAPWPNEMPKAVEAFAEIEGLKIDQGGIQVILETLGNDLQKIKNELVRISLHCGAAKSQLTRAEIAPFLGALKEEDVYQLDRYLLDRKWAMAQSLVVSLIDRGEKPLSVLAMLTNHCRNVLNVADGRSKGFTDHEISERSRLPAFIMKNYLQAGRHAPVASYTAALAACHRADRLLKSTPVGESLILGQVIAHLS
jgi:DNA polymerase-3 subunit delta